MRIPSRHRDPLWTAVSIVAAALIAWAILFAYESGHRRGYHRARLEFETPAPVHSAPAGPQR